jgi:hypothetical protein
MGAAADWLATAFALSIAVPLQLAGLSVPELLAPARLLSASAEVLDPAAAAGALALIAAAFAGCGAGCGSRRSVCKK